MSSKKIKIGEELYDIDQLSEKGIQYLSSLEFSDARIKELKNFFAILLRAKNSYISELRSEVLASKSGLIIEEWWVEIKLPKITIDDIEYNSEDLSDNGKAQLASLQFLEVQMKKIKAEIAVYQTARNTYIGALKAELDASEWLRGARKYSL